MPAPVPWQRWVFLEPEGLPKPLSMLLQLRHREEKEVLLCVLPNMFSEGAR